MMKKAFSLMEMMVVLLIVSVVAAASAPMLNKKILTTAAERSPWVRTEGLSIAFNLNGDDDTSATIGAIHPSGSGVPRLAIEANAGTTAPHISFGRGGSRVAGLWLGDSGINLSSSNNNNNSNSIVMGIDSRVAGSSNTIALGNNVTLNRVNDRILIGNQFIKDSTAGPRGIISIGYNNSDSVANGQIAIGCLKGDSVASRNNAITIGHEVKLESRTSQPTQWGRPAILSNPENSIAIGAGVLVQDRDCVTIGAGAKSVYQASVAIGSGALSENANTIAIGNVAEAEGPRSIALGNSAMTEFDDAIAIGDSAGVRAMASYTVSNWNKPTGSISIGKEAICPNGKNAIAIGLGTHSMGDGSIAIGRSASAGYPDGNASSVGAAIAIGDDASADFANSIAIGAGVSTTAANQIVLGRPEDTVYIPGNLVVGKNAYIGIDGVLNGGDSNVSTNLYLRTDYHNNLVRAYALSGNNNLFGWGDYSTELETLMSSDRRLKDVGKAFIGGLEEIKKLEVFNYTYKKDKTKTPHVGVMAQDLQKVFPKAVFKGEDGFLRIRMEDMFYALVNAVKELDKKIDLLAQKQKKIDELEKTVDKLEKRLAELEKKMK